MKKYLAAGGVAVVAFAFAASAAQLNVQASTLQVGQDRDLSCADGANVAAWGYEDHGVSPNLANVKIDVVNETCDDGEALHVVLLQADGTEYKRGVSQQTNGKAYADLDGTGEYVFDFTGADPRYVEGIRIGIDQGHVDYSY